MTVSEMLADAGGALVIEMPPSIASAATTAAIRPFLRAKDPDLYPLLALAEPDWRIWHPSHGCL
jgi:hypothetical protein